VTAGDRPGPEAPVNPADDEPRAAGARRAADEPRPLIERIGLALIAIVLAGAFAVMGIAAWTGGEGFLAVMALVGALMTLWAAGSSVWRG
jgi:uncharacterized RDD family membrane protein YckC